METIFTREALLQERIGDRVRCNTCERRCTLVDGGTGWCRTRHNRGGKLVTLTYGAVSSLSANPIEKKPLYHFYPGTHALTSGSWSCNFGCPWCQNWRISKTPPQSTGSYLSPERFVEMAEETGCRGVMVGRAALGNPWIFEEIRGFLDGKELRRKPSVRERALTCLRHLRGTIAESGRHRGIRRFRTQAVFYTKGFRGAADARRRLQRARSAREIARILKDLYGLT